jgi:hypothetical protein
MEIGSSICLHGLIETLFNLNVGNWLFGREYSPNWKRGIFLSTRTLVHGIEREGQASIVEEQVKGTITGDTLLWCEETEHQFVRFPGFAR